MSTELSRRQAGAAVLAGGVLVGAASSASAAHPAAGAEGTRGKGSHWLATWAAVPTAVPSSAVVMLRDQTVRQVVHVSVGGGHLRLRLSNEFGTTALTLDEVRVARRNAGSGTSTLPGTDRAVTFSGAKSVVIPAGSPAVSDPVELRVPSATDLVVSIYVSAPTPVTTMAAFAYQQNEIVSGNATSATRVQPSSVMASWYFLSGVSVLSSTGSAIVALGDSITNGAESTPGTNQRWPDLLAWRLRRAGRGDRPVVNLGVSGNRLLHDANPPQGSPAEGYAHFFGRSVLARFDRDVVAQPGVDTVIMLIGVNDLGHPGTTAPIEETVSAADIIAGYRQVIARCRLAGLQIFGCTILPFKGDTFGFYSEVNAAKRHEINAWIRTSGAFDAVIDVDAVMRDPADPERMRAAYDSGDHLHPSDAGMKALADAVPLRLLTQRDRRSTPIG